MNDIELFSVPARTLIQYANDVAAHGPAAVSPHPVDPSVELSRDARIITHWRGRFHRDVCVDEINFDGHCIWDIGWIGHSLRGIGSDNEIITYNSCEVCGLDSYCVQMVRRGHTGLRGLPTRNHNIIMCAQCALRQKCPPEASALFCPLCRHAFAVLYEPMEHQGVISRIDSPYWPNRTEVPGGQAQFCHICAESIAIACDRLYSAEFEHYQFGFADPAPLLDVLGHG